MCPCSLRRTFSTIISGETRVYKNSLCLSCGKRLSTLRNQKGVTQEQLAEASGLSVDFLSLIERGRRAPSFKTLEQLSKALGLSVRDLFDFENKE